MEAGQRRVARHGLPRIAADASPCGRDRVAAGERVRSGHRRTARQRPEPLIDNAPVRGHWRASLRWSFYKCGARGRAVVQQPDGAVSLSGLRATDRRAPEVSGESQAEADRVPGLAKSRRASGEARPVPRLERRSARAQRALAGLQHALSDSAVGCKSSTWPRTFWAAWPSVFRKTGSGSTRIRFIGWKPSSIPRFRGTCYRAANWMVLGRTTGRGKDDQTHRANRSIKEVLGLPVIRRFRELLQRAARDV